MKYIDIDLLVRKNYKTIINKTYRWKDEEISAIYKFVTYFVNRNVIFSVEKDDIIQELVFVFFNRVITNFDINSSAKISTYAITAFKNYCIDYTNRKIKEIDKHLISQQTLINKEITIGDLLEADFDIEEMVSIIDKKRIINRLKELFKDDDIMCDYCFSKVEYSKAELARKYNKSRVYIGKYINNKIEKAKKDKLLKGYMQGY